MEDSIKEWTGKVAKLSNDFEENTSDIKRKYLIRNIVAFNYIASLIKVSKGTFGTGYPFYLLDRNLQGELHIIGEQIRYNNELLQHAERSKLEKWNCAGCLSSNYKEMPDLKQICKPCPNMDDELKPRRLINRLPDMDMWLVCEDGHIQEAENGLSELFSYYHIQTSDINPIQTINDVEEIVEKLNKGIIPKKFLPVDAHIIEYTKLKELIEQVPETLKQAKAKRKIPYLPIHPRSYRKKWQYDDEAYNFIYDFLSAFTEYGFTYEMEDILNQTRGTIVKSYTPEQLFLFLLISATDANRRRFKTPDLEEIFKRRIDSWKSRNNNDNKENIEK